MLDFIRRITMKRITAIGLTMITLFGCVSCAAPSSSSSTPETSVVYGTATEADFWGAPTTEKILQDVHSGYESVKTDAKIDVLAAKGEYEDRLEEAIGSMNDMSGGQFYKGTLRSGQVLESDSSIIILGDVNPGAKILSAGNVVVLGSLKGTVYAGIKGNPNAFVVALEMHPVQIKIGDIIARCADKPKKLSTPETKIAYVDGKNIYIEPLNREVLNDLNF